MKLAARRGDPTARAHECPRRGAFARPARRHQTAERASLESDELGEESPDSPEQTGYVIETVISPFHCLYQDALAFHTQSRLARSDSEASRLARAALLLYVSSAEALVHQAAADLGRPELRSMLVDPSRPIPLYEAWRLLPAIAGEPGSHPQPFDPEAPPWPQFAELLALAGFVGLSRHGLAAQGVLPIAGARRRLRTARAARDSFAFTACRYHRPPDMAAHRDCRATRMPCGRGTWTRHEAFSMPPFSRSTAAWAARSRRASAIAESPSGSSTRRRKPKRRDHRSQERASPSGRNALDGASGHADLDRQFVSDPRRLRRHGDAADQDPARAQAAGRRRRGGASPRAAAVGIEHRAQANSKTRRFTPFRPRPG